MQYLIHVDVVCILHHFEIIVLNRLLETNQYRYMFMTPIIQ